MSKEIRNTDLYKFKWELKVDKQNVLDKLSNSLTSFTPVIGFFTQADRNFFGKVRGDRFKIYYYGNKCKRNSFSPILYGKVKDSSKGCTIEAKFTLPRIVLGFSSLWLIGALASPAFALIAIPFFILMLIFGYLWSNKEKGLIYEYLIRMFGSKIVSKEEVSGISII